MRFSLDELLFLDSRTILPAELSFKNADILEMNTVHGSLVVFLTRVECVYRLMSKEEVGIRPLLKLLLQFSRLPLHTLKPVLSILRIGIQHDIVHFKDSIIA